MSEYSDNLTDADVEAVLRSLPDHAITGDEIAVIISEVVMRFFDSRLEAVAILGQAVTFTAAEGGQSGRAGDPMTDRTLRISARIAEEIQQWASDELSQWPRDTAETIMEAMNAVECPCKGSDEICHCQNRRPTPDDLIDLIGEFGREVYYLLDNCETSGPDGEEIHTITEDGLRKVSAILDRIDDLPFAEPGVMLGTGAMLQAAIMQTFAHPPQPAGRAMPVGCGLPCGYDCNGACFDPPQPSETVEEAMKHLHDIINCGNCSGSRQSARLALRALKGYA